mgnify:CR=1 FL=1
MASPNPYDDILADDVNPYDSVIEDEDREESAKDNDLRNLVAISHDAKGDREGILKTAEATPYMGRSTELITAFVLGDEKKAKEKGNGATGPEKPVKP